MNGKSPGDLGGVDVGAARLVEWAIPRTPSGMAYDFAALLGHISRGEWEDAERELADLRDRRWRGFACGLLDRLAPLIAARDPHTTAAEIESVIFVRDPRMVERVHSLMKKAPA